MIVIISCGKAKQNTTCKARYMYIGNFHRACLEYAQSIANDESIFILSAKYGVLSLDDTIEPYECRLGQTDSISASKILEQAKQKGIENEQVIALGGKDYANLIKEVWQDVECPIAGFRGFGYQIQWLKQNSKKYVQERLF